MLRLIKDLTLVPNLLKISRENSTLLRKTTRWDPLQLLTRQIKAKVQCLSMATHIEGIVSNICGTSTANYAHNASILVLKLRFTRRKFKITWNKSNKLPLVLQSSVHQFLKQLNHWKRKVNQRRAQLVCTETKVLIEAKAPVEANQLEEHHLLQSN